MRKLIRRYHGSLCVYFVNVCQQPSAPKGLRLPDSLCAKLHQCLEESIYYDEVLVAFSRLQTECRDFVSVLKRYGATINTVDYLPE